MTQVETQKCEQVLLCHTNSATLQCIDSQLLARDTAGGLPVAGSVVWTQSVILARGDSGRPLGLKSWVEGNVKGSSSSCTAFASYRW